MITTLYVLMGRLPVPCTDVRAWSEWRMTADCHVAETAIGPLRVSTVFLGIDHNFGFRDNGDAILFETMIFGADAEGDRYQTRCATWDEAERMHEIGVTVANGLLARANDALAGKFP